MLRNYFSMFNCFSKRFLTTQQPAVFDWIKQDKIIMEPFEYLKKIPCKHHRMIAPAFNHWLQVPAEKLEAIQEANKTLITWALLLDDMEDDTPLRYGEPSAHRVFGLSATLIAAHKGLVLGKKQVAKLGHPLAPKVLLEWADEYFRGLGTDAHCRDKFVCLTEEEHIEVNKKKSSSFALPVALLQLFSKNKTDYIELALNVGVYYYLVDDYYNMFQPQSLKSMAAIHKEATLPYCDVTECKLSLAVIHASQFPDVATELADILKQRTRDPKLQKRAIYLLKKHGSDEYMRDKVKKHEADLRAEIDKLGGNPKLTRVIDLLSIQ